MSYQTINPTTGKLEKSFPEATDAECLAALTTADTCYRSDWSLRPVVERAKIVRRAAQILRAKRQVPELTPTRMRVKLESAVAELEH
jgi:succinate-semialdehyde dehydrogenase / glutarate-semialdehyde dehydrogenase